MRNLLAVALAASAFSAVAPDAVAQQGHEIALSLGFNTLSLDGNDVLDGQDGGRFEPRLSFQPFEDRPQVRFGFALGFSYFYDESDAGHIVSPPFAFPVDSYEDVFLLTPEFQLSWREPLGEQWWVEGGIGIGPVFGFYSAGVEIFDDVISEDVQEEEVGLGLRPFARAAWHGDRWSWGVEAAYQWTTIDLGSRYGGDVSEWYVGVFVGYGR